MQTNDPSLLFQTDQQLHDEAKHKRKYTAAKHVGSPITVSGKILDMVVRGEDVWTAESGWVARRTNLRSGESTRLYRGHNGPVTCIAILHIGGSTPWDALFTGSWDTTIRVWDAELGTLVCIIEGHADFVKSLTILPLDSPILISTSSDRTIRTWDLLPLIHRQMPTSIQKVKEHTRPIDCLAFHVDREDTGTIRVWSGDSLGVIKEWTLDQRMLVWVRDVPGHETSVTDLWVSEEGLWSASMDKNAILHPFHENAHYCIEHAGYVKSILGGFPAKPGALVILTGSEDEDIRVWDVTGFPTERARLVSTVQGHCGEVSVLRLWRDNNDGALKVVSGSLDGTIRRWSAQELMQPKPLIYESEEGLDDIDITEEEERELAELLSDTD